MQTGDSCSHARGHGRLREVSRFFNFDTVRGSRPWTCRLLGNSRFPDTGRPKAVNRLSRSYHAGETGECGFGPDPSGYSFPSGHAMGSVCFYGVLGGLLSTRIKRKSLRVLVWLATATLILGIGLSRIYLGVHYFTDVVAGYCAAGVWVSTLLFVARIRHRE